MASVRGSVRLATKQTVYFRESAQPYVGFESSNDVSGWLFDQKRWNSVFDLRLPTLPRLSDQSLQGVKESEYFQSGVGSLEYNECLVSKIESMDYNLENLWMPIINPGSYYRFSTKHQLYSDRSRVQYIDPEQNRNNKNYILLDATPDYLYPLTLVNYCRDPESGTPLIRNRVSHVAKFSGLYEDGEELDTRSISGDVNWPNVDMTKHEFIVGISNDNSTYIKANKDYIFTDGIIPTTIADLQACYSFGPSNGSEYQVFYTRYFPVITDNSFHLYLTNGIVYSELEKADSWFDLINTDKQNMYFVDQDLGAIYFGDAKHGGVPPIGYHLVGSYRVTMRLEYEEEDKKKTIFASDADVNPMSQIINQGFICITSKQFEAYKISLKIDKSLIPFTSPREYGPIYVGSDYGVLQATVTDIEGIPIPGVDVGFTMSPVIGYLSSGSESESSTNGQGIAFTAYQPPTSADSIGIYSNIVRASLHSEYPGPDYNELIVSMSDTITTSDLNNIYTYKIMKDDIIIGYETVQDWIYYNMEVPAWVVDAATYARWQEEIILENDLKDWTGIQSDGSIPGRKILIYQIDNINNIDSAAINPISGVAPAVMPVRPVAIEKISDGDPDGYSGMWRIVYDAGVISPIDNSINPNNIGGYWIAMPRSVIFQAHCYSEYYNRIIYSNKILARISLPQYLLGVYTNNLLQNIPFGWKLRTDTDNISAGLNGATFISINPRNGPYKILDLVNNIESDTWASAPQDSLGLKFNITE